MRARDRPEPSFAADGSRRTSAAGSDRRRARSRRCRRTVPAAPRSGSSAKQWESERLPLPPEWAILLYTDGIVEGRVGRGSERLGETGLQELLSERIARLPGWREQPEALLDELIEDAERLNGEALSDDVAMLLFGARADAQHG